MVVVGPIKGVVVGSLEGVVVVPLEVVVVVFRCCSSCSSLFSRSNLLLCLSFVLCLLLLLVVGGFEVGCITSLCCSRCGVSGLLACCARKILESGGLVGAGPSTLVGVS